MCKTQSTELVTGLSSKLVRKQSPNLQIHKNKCYVVFPRKELVLAGSKYGVRVATPAISQCYSLLFLQTFLPCSGLT